MRALALLTTAVLGLGLSHAGAQDIGDPMAGHDFARSLCATCHAVEDDDAPSPYREAPPFRAVARVPGMTATALSVFLRTPHANMPDLILSTEERRNVIAYILTLDGNN